MDLQLFGETFVTLFVITDPPGMVPIYLALTGTLSTKARHRAGTQAVALAFGVIVFFAVAGQRILDYLNIELPALQGAGGLLLVLVALQLLTGKTDDPSEQKITTNVALVPLGTPLLAGPGAIVATMLFVRRAEGTVDYVTIGVAITAVMATVWIVLRFSGVIVRILRPERHRSGDPDRRPASRGDRGPTHRRLCRRFCH